MDIIYSTLVGACFGFVMEKGGVVDPTIIKAQFTFQQWTMMKMFLGAAATSTLVHTTLSLFPKGSLSIEAARCWNIPPRSYSSVFLGAVLLGAGMLISGSCPGTVAIQIGSGAGMKALEIFSGGLLGALVYSFLEPKLRSFERPSDPVPQALQSHMGLDKKLNVSYWKLALPLSTLLAGATFVLEKLFPFKSEVPVFPLSFYEFLTLRYWPPYLTGICVGLLQLPYILLLTRSIGSSSAYVTLVSKILSIFFPSFVKNNSYLSAANSGIKSWIQPSYLFGAILGGFLSSKTSGSYGGLYYSMLNITPLEAIIGGFFLVFGSRLADGCTSGHGVSGFAQLGQTSMVAVPAMFGSAIALAFALSFIA